LRTVCIAVIFHNMTSKLEIKQVMSALAKMRWRKVSKADRTAHAKRLAEARHGKKRN